MTKLPVGERQQATKKLAKAPVHCRVQKKHKVVNLTTVTVSRKPETATELNDHATSQHQHVSISQTGN